MILVSLESTTAGMSMGLVRAGGTSTKASFTGSWNHVGLTTLSQALVDARAMITLSGDLSLAAKDSVGVRL